MPTGVNPLPLRHRLVETSTHAVVGILIDGLLLDKLVHAVHVGSCLPRLYSVLESNILYAHIPSESGGSRSRSDRDPPPGPTIFDSRASWPSPKYLLSPTDIAHHQ